MLSLGLGVTSSLTSVDALVRGLYSAGGVLPRVALDFDDNNYVLDSGPASFNKAFMGTSPKLTYNPGSASSSQSTMTQGYGPELVTNRTFDTDVSGWTAGLNAVVTWSSESMQVERVTGTNDVGYQVLTCEVGSVYEVSVDVTNAGTGAQGRFGISKSVGGGFSAFLVEVQSGLAVGSYTQVFVANSTSMVLGCGGVGTTAYDNISVREAPKIVWAPHNLALNSAAPATQTITVTSGADYTVEVTGTGSMALTGAGTGTATDGSPATITASTTSLTITLTSSLDTVAVYRSDLGGMAPVPGAATGFETYVPTNGAAVYLPRVGHHVYNGSAWVNEGLLIESEPRTNLVYPSQFPTSAVGLWAAPNGATAVVDQTGPDGLTSATTLTASSTGNSLRCRITTTQSGSTTYTLSFYAKAGSSAYVYARNIAVSGATAVDGVWWDVSDFSVAVQGSGVAVAGSQPVGNGWYRCYMTATTASSPANNLVDIGIADTAGTVSTTSGDTGIFYGAQLEAGSTPSSYIPTNGSTVIRGAQSLVVPAHWYDADNPTYTGPELVVDGSGNWVGDFDAAADVSEWTGRNANTQLSLDANRLRVEAGAADTAYAYKRPTADANKVYRVTLDYENVQGVVRVYAGIGPGTNTYYDSGNLTGSGSLDFVFVPTSADPYLSVYASVSNTLGDASLFDNISVRQVSAPQFGWPEPEYIGPELVDNGDFSLGDNGDWTPGGGWSIDAENGVALTTSAGNLTQVDFVPSVRGKVMMVSYDIVSPMSGSIAPYFQQVAPTVDTNRGTYRNAVGSYVDYFVVPSNALYFGFNTNATAGSIDNVSVREINPLSVSIQMDGRMTYADTDVVTEAVPWYWDAGGTNRIFTRLNTAGGTGKMSWIQVADYEETGESQFSPGINVPFNIASRHGSTFIDAAVDGVALTGGTTPTALPDLSSTNLQIAYDFMGTIGQFRQFAGDVGDAGLVTATNPSTEPTLSLTFDGTASGSFYNLNWSE